MKILFDEMSSSVRIGTNRLELPYLSLKLLQVLYSHKNTVVTTDKLMSEVWSETIVTPDTVKQRVFLLRQALQQAEVSKLDVLSIRGTGYCLKVKKNPIFVLGISVIGLLLFALAVRYVLTPLSDNVNMVNNRVVLWELTETNTPFEDYQRLTRTMRTMLSKSDVLLFVENYRDMNLEITSQARNVRAGLVILWQGVVEVDQKFIAIQIVEPKSSVVLLNDKILIDNTESTITKLTKLKQRLELVIISPHLPLSANALKDTSDPAWQALKAILNN